MPRIVLLPDERLGPEDLLYVHGTPEEAIEIARLILETAGEAIEKSDREVPREIVSAMGLLRLWVQVNGTSGSVRRLDGS